MRAARSLDATSVRAAGDLVKGASAEDLDSSVRARLCQGTHGVFPVHLSKWRAKSPGAAASAEPFPCGFKGLQQRR